MRSRGSSGSSRADPERSGGLGRHPSWRNLVGDVGAVGVRRDIVDLFPFPLGPSWDGRRVPKTTKASEGAKWVRYLLYIRTPAVGGRDGARGLAVFVELRTCALQGSWKDWKGRPEALALLVGGRPRRATIVSRSEAERGRAGGRGSPSPWSAEPCRRRRSSGKVLYTRERMGQWRSGRRPNTRHPRAR